MEKKTNEKWWLANKDKVTKEDLDPLNEEVWEDEKPVTPPWLDNRSSLHIYTGVTWGYSNSGRTYANSGATWGYSNSGRTYANSGATWGWIDGIYINDHRPINSGTSGEPGTSLERPGYSDGQGNHYINPPNFPELNPEQIAEREWNDLPLG